MLSTCVKRVSPDVSLRPSRERSPSYHGDGPSRSPLLAGLALGRGGGQGAAHGDTLVWPSSRLKYTVIRVSAEKFAPYAACLIRDSAGMPSPLCSFQAMAMVSGRLWLRISYTRLGWPM